MRKIILSIFILLLICHMTNAQGMDAINRIYPAAPTANNLMKFEEIPVSYYTGVPNIDIPIYTIPSDKIQIPVILSYHVLSAKPDDISSEVGLGWSLIAGGTIARTVKGLPDEAIKDNLGSGRQGIGIYIDEFSNHPNYNGYYRNHIATYLNILANNGSPFTDSYFRKTGFEAGVFNRYDGQYDVYQYNFLGYTGRFIIKKNSANGFEVIKLDINNLKITSEHNNKYEPVSFTIIDEQGKEYIFNIVEKTQRSFMVDKVSQLSDSPEASIGQIDEYNSAFHLSSVKNAGGYELASFEYNLPQEVNTSSTSITNNSPVYNPQIEDYIKQQIDAYLPPKSQIYTTNSLNKTRTLKRVTIPGSGKIDFIYTGNDPNLGFTTVPVILSEILIKDYSEKIVEKVLLSQQISYTPILATERKRMKLTGVTHKNILNNVLSEYKLNYYPSANLNSIKDGWGYASCYNGYSCLYSDVLQSITYPTGGKTEFSFEPNTFSYAGQSPGLTLPLISNYEQNPNNWIWEDGGVSFDKFKEPQKFMFKIDSEQDVNFTYSMASIPGSDWRLELYWGNGQITSSVPDYYLGTLYNGITTPQGTVKIHLPPGHYYARLDTDDAGAMFQTFNYVSVTASYKEYKTSGIEKFLYGGGFSINTIKYLDHSGALIKQKNFSYRDPSDNMQSSGALVYPYPVLNYDDGFITKLWYANSFFWNEFINYNNLFRVKSSVNLLPVLKTKGSDVGYEYVTVFETDKGKTINKYTSPRAFPNSEIINTLPPFLPIIDEDYKRGNLIKEEIKDNNNVLLREKSLNYSTRAENIITGLVFRTSPQEVYLSQYDTYEDFLYFKQNCGSTFTGIKCSYIESTPLFPVQYSVETTNISKVNYTGSETKEFFNGQQNSFNKTTEQTIYNTIDLPVKSNTTYPDNSSTETSYRYAHEKNNTKLINANIIGTPLEIENKKNNKTITKVETLYNDITHYLPTSIISHYLNNVAQTEVTYDQYDSKGNLQQYTTKDGIVTSIIWGYSSTQPIAKVTGVSYSVASGLATEIIAASDADINVSTEQNLIDKLDLFRKESALQNAQISTYTYDPLIGVTSITPPSGIREIYKYDSANRLENIKDINGKLLKEFKYNYKH
ncbi:hypothetical protein NAL32_00695 [Chryseobacterium sp. Ch-15]|uniref:YD repeat-containing protein n=1 Tax=Chryseobacterium muglaense TaxID=2893752 RepID=A0A9Q3UVA5_9FLAO|nr:hypothetical protein [Chryseobacterium muglaense]MBD3903566.1 hypothetical protein [Chryseobacterium muglaense]MCC9034638.1 hypothetical protein [Chryseobacterium muglaense]MCM2552901.1 hypothetical protein [Chryseobacterium muglaense]